MSSSDLKRGVAIPALIYRTSTTHRERYERRRTLARSGIELGEAD
jgi:hypothetical protein